MAPATGEKSFSTRGRQTYRFDNTPVPSNDYEAKLRTSKARVDRKNEPGKQPFIGGVSLELLGTASEGGRNRILYVPYLACTLKVGEGGKTQVDRQDQLLGLAMALGTVVDTIQEVVSNFKDEEGNPVRILNPQQYLAWLKNQDGKTIKVHTKIRREKDGPGRAEVDYFIEAEGADSGPDGGDEPGPDADDAEPEDDGTDNPPEPEPEPVTPPKKGKKK